MTDIVETPEKPICQYCGQTPRTTLKNHYKHCKDKPRPNPPGKRGRPKGSGKGKEKVGNSGRKSGTRNKTTLTAKQSIQEVFEELGGVEAMTAWAVRNQTEFYTKIYTKILPLDSNIKHNVDQIPGLTVNLTHKPKDKGGDDES